MAPALTSLHDPFNAGVSTASTVPEDAPSPMTFLDLSEYQASAALHDPFTLSKQVHLGDSYTIPNSAACSRYNFGCHGAMVKKIYNKLSILILEGKGKNSKVQTCSQKGLRLTRRGNV